jgi:hypothetical protein
MTTQERSRPLSLYVLTLCLVFLAVGALYGGFMLLSDVSGGALQIPQEWLAGSIFPNYFVPGLFLFTVFGLGSLVVLFGLWVRPQWAWLATLLLGAALVIWIFVQYLSINHYHPLQIVMLLLGVFIVVLDLLPGMRRYHHE